MTSSLKNVCVLIALACLVDQAKQESCCEKADSASGPHTLACLTRWWLDAGCSVDGISSPTAHSGPRGYWNRHSVGEVKNDMIAYRRLALQRQSGHGTTYMQLCFGDPGNCGEATRVGPHPGGCLMAWWLSAGCSTGGFNSPNNKQTAYWDNRDGATVRADMLQYRILALKGLSGHGRLYTEWCYGEKFQDCNARSGPYPMHCLMKWWLDAGCTPDGTTSPNRHRNLFWHARTVSEVKADMAKYHQYAVLRKDNYRVQCGNA